ncbi:epidermal growth factor receptor kinase substrate 8-like isoform X1 [Onthophagus taurus]|uniref:epidermal growth factor receptor kinase substrate 8-like isoform X1 n=1 Tax=Onthophagus taurus TaxID=166361 RepID=UPI0039BE9FB3
MAYHSNGYSRDDDIDRDDRNVDDKLVYLVEHLATFTVAKDNGITNSKDGMRRLLQLEKSNGIWSQKMQLRLDRSSILIMDYETGGIMERFPYDNIQEPTAFTSADPMEMYNNILVFSVTNSNSSHPIEMHIFQCQSISAQDLVEDLKQLQMGKTLTRSRKTSIPPQSQKPPGQHVMASRDYREIDSELATNNDDNSSTTSDQYERDVTVLNHCFDDIEKFIARLQVAAAASKELERRKRNRKSKKGYNGDGMLKMRTKPPHENEFIDIFQKFKLSFNLLAKLRAHIHDPNAPELVHFLFTPLALIVEASHDTYFDLHLPHKVIAPLLTRDAINLLANCVTSKETELWHSLGNAWLVPRDEWKAQVPSYHPVFLDKWSPDYKVVDELESDSKHFRDMHNEYSSDYNDYDTSNQDNMFLNGGRYSDNHDREPKIEPERDMDPISARSDISVDSIERNGDDRSFKRLQDNWLESLQKRNAQIVKVTYPRTANNDKELTVVRGEYLEILDDSRKWWKARNFKGEVAHVPHTIVTKVNPDIYNNPLYAHYGNRPDSSSDRFSDGQVHGSDHVSSPPSVNTASAEQIRQQRLEPETPPPPPPPMPPIDTAPTTPVSTLKRTASIKSTMTNGEKMYDELNTVLSLFRNKRTDLDIKQTPEVYINQKSNPSEVESWLAAKEFSPSVCTKLKNFSGHQILGLNKDNAEKIAGPLEGKRLYSQLTIQKNVCGYQTVRSSELRAILAKAREKFEKED